MTDVAAQVTALDAALETGEYWLDPAIVQQVRVTMARSVKRLELGADHTVVALVGATGSGKSSLLNALATMEIAEVGARRPMTSLPMACVWGEGGSEELLDWLDVPAGRRITRESVLDADLQAPLNGLVLLDLPDHDSTEVVHRVEVDRLVTMVDLLVWVVDPQKYADDALHSGYLQRMVGHDSVMVVVLNQIDRLGAEEAETCVRDLRRLLDGDGLAAVPMLAVSARRGDGVDDLRTILAGVVQNRSAIVERVAADLRSAVDDLRTGLAATEPGNATPPGADLLVTELAAAAGVPVVLDAVAAEYRRRGWIRARWPVLRWLRRLTPDRLGRLGGAVDEQDLKVITSGLTPVSAPSQRPQVELAVQRAVAASADPLPVRWADAVRESVSQAQADLTTTLDQRVAGVDLALSAPPWWRVATVVQHLLALAAVVGAVWLVLLGVDELAGADLVSPVRVLGGLPLPVLLLVVGLLAGAALAALGAWVLVVGARRRRAAAGDRLLGAVRQVADEQVTVPIRLVLTQHRATRLALSGHGSEPVDAGTAPPAEPVVATPETRRAGRLAGAASLAAAPIGESAVVGDFTLIEETALTEQTEPTEPNGQTEPTGQTLKV